MRRIASHHAEWLELLEVSGPFLSLPVLERVFPQGLDALDADASGRLRLARDEWADEQEQPRPDPSVHAAWTELVLRELLEFGDDVLLDATRENGDFAIALPEHSESLRPDFILTAPGEADEPTEARMLIQVLPSRQDLDALVDGSEWAASPATRMATHCRELGVRLGLLTNGERWLLVHAAQGETTTFVSWYASLWTQEPITLRAFRSLLGVRRFFGVDRRETLEAMIAESAAYQAEVTEQLGAQVRRAVEVLVQAIDRADVDSGRRLLRGVSEDELYEAGLVVMMRLVFLFYAEENDLLPLGDELYQQSYAASTLRGQLREAADQVGIEVLERRQDAWSRLIATFRAIHGGIGHEALRLPPYGGSLFDPDRFPFLEGRQRGVGWRDTYARPLPIDNRTVLHLLDALQVLRMRGSTGLEARKLSFRGLDIEQIGHVYETLLDHRVVRADSPLIGLAGPREPEVSLDELDRGQGRGAAVGEYLAERTGKSRSAVERALAKPVDHEWQERLRVACGDDHRLAERVRPFGALIRSDPWGEPVVIREGSVFVTAGSERRATGTYYTPRALTEEMVTHALEPVVYDGPAEGKPRDAWGLKAPAELLELKVCDPAMGSGAFLVQVVRWLSERLVEAWDAAEQHTGVPIAVDGRAAKADPSEIVVPSDADERLALARRLVADRCTYGVDVNPLAVEMAKLSIWLVTLAKGLPFSFLDHALKCGDSLLGIHDLDQLSQFHLDPERGRDIHHTLFDPRREIGQIVGEATATRLELEGFTVRDSRDAEQKAALNDRAERATDELRLLGDLLVGTGLSAAHQRDGGFERLVSRIADDVSTALEGDASIDEDGFRARARELLDAGKPRHKPPRRPFHWPLEFPEVFARKKPGFDAMVSNPPYIGNKYWKERLGADFQPYFASLLGRRLGKPDVIVLFIWRMVELLRPAGIASSLATQSITEVDSKNLVQAIVLGDATIIRAFRARPWPGDATVVVSLIWLRKGPSNGGFVLDGATVPGIGADLRPTFGEEPAGLKGALVAFQGVDNSRGMAFVVKSDDPLCRHQSLFKPYVSGEDLAKADPARPSRFVLDLTGWDEEDFRTLPPDVHRFLYGFVKPTRTDHALRPYKGLAKRWWTYWNTREEGFGVVRQQDLCVVVPAVAKFLFALRMPSAWVYTNKVLLFAVTRPDVQTLLLSASFDAWALKYGGTLGGTRVTKIAPVVGTFPLPRANADPRLGEDWQATVLRARRQLGPGISDVLNSVHTPGCDETDILHLRQVMEEIHASVAAAYGWSELVDPFDFHETIDGIRWSPSSTVRNELLQRLHDLNVQQSTGRKLSA